MDDLQKPKISEAWKTRYAKLCKKVTKHNQHQDLLDGQTIYRNRRKIGKEMFRLGNRNQRVKVKSHNFGKNRKSR